MNELPHDGDKADFGRFAVSAEALVKRAEDGVCPGGADGGHVENVADLRPTAADMARAVPEPGVVGMRSDATGTIPATDFNPEIVLTDESDIDRITVGARLSLGIPKLVVEATQAEQRSYSAKLSIGF